MGEIENARDRTDQKLRFSELHLGELEAHEAKGTADDFERAHQESFLFHLIGALDAFFQELNIHYGCSLPLKLVTKKSLREKLHEMGCQSQELDAIDKLQTTPGSWLWFAAEFRRIVTHRGNMPLWLNIGGDDHRKIFLKDPTTGQKIRVDDYVVVFKDWLDDMRSLIRGNKAKLAE